MLMTKALEKENMSCGEWFGLVVRSQDVHVGTKVCTLRAWAVRRMGANERFDKEVVLEVRGSAWRPDPERGGDESYIHELGRNT